ncbi:PstS family phosphate ABC transporter substrate-binding protein [Dolichospermum circinale]|uniref:PstS family phosphate ABC transporter substrate-binding protein n=1 Tax=Dolichospermum circinale TaxID=109265 RepID=UPI00232D0C05|nr:PstS family phosphate ABC transporter substrate-binding protein [Dolichospermum circinale]MDB9455470.1 PstS family phosphate ABC transporter substrate-binding protein [Dolichospermum circinale CS-541/06]MDB9461805.1 PstS family phosphate ABC transporter substrate-binding protein [Dolichospermum circinale CS-541/04]
MSPKKETLPLFLSLIATISLIFGGSWFLIERWAKISSNMTSTSSSNNSQNLSSNSVTSCNLPNLPQGIFSYGGSTTWATIRKDVDSVLQRICPQFVLRYIQPLFKDPGSETGIQMLIDNQLAFTQSSRSIKLEETSQAQQKGFRLKEIIVAIDGIAIAVNHNLNIPGLTTAQIKDIYTGKVTNWQKLGGANLPIIPLSRGQEAGGTVDFFIEYVLNKDKFGNNVSYIGTTTEAIRKIANTPGGIYYGSAPEIVPQCTVKSLPIGRTKGQFVTPYQQPEIAQSQCPNQRNQLSTENFRNGNYPITRNLFVIIKQNAQSDQQAGEAYANWLLTPQGQELIEKAGFVSIK